jgi:hypothetical protein
MWVPLIVSELALSRQIRAGAHLKVADRCAHGRVQLRLRRLAGLREGPQRLQAKTHSLEAVACWASAASGFGRVWSGGQGVGQARGRPKGRYALPQAARAVGLCARARVRVSHAHTHPAVPLHLLLAHGRHVLQRDLRDVGPMWRGAACQWHAYTTLRAACELDFRPVVEAAFTYAEREVQAQAACWAVGRPLSTVPALARR